MTYIKHSGLGKKMDKTVHQNVETRWNSHFVMLQSVLTQFKEIEQVLEDKDVAELIAEISQSTL